jgi:ACS family hexuronate transporter-like MFS transporter
VAPLVVPWITLTYGWQEAFIATGSIGFLWLGFWWFLYEVPQRSRRVSRGELAYIQSDPPDPPEKIPLSKLLTYKEAWAFAVAKFMTDPIWWFYLYWVPKFLNKTYGLTLDKIGPPLIVIYLLADIGSVGGGWLSSAFIKRGWEVNKGRKVAMLICALAVTPIVFASQASEVWIAVALLGLATAAHQGWSANLFTTASDVFPRKAIGSIVGFGGMAGAVGGVLLSGGAGLLLEFTGSYMTLFIIAGVAYILALGVYQILSPKLQPVRL